MSPLFGKKQVVRALAEVLENGRAAADQEMQKIKYRNYRGAEPMLSIGVRVQPIDAPPFEASMQAGLGKSFLLMPGVRVQVSYDTHHPTQVRLEDEQQAILERNPQLKIEG
jgi:hypothetical protein